MRERPSYGTCAASLLAALALCSAASALAGAAIASATGTSWRSARAARMISGADEAHLRFLHASVRGNSEVLYETGKATGALPGSMNAEVEITPTLLVGTCTIKTKDGSTITGRGRATPSGTGRFESFRGSLTITKGTGRYAHIRGRAGLYGTFDHRTFALVVQTTGELSY